MKVLDFGLAKALQGEAGGDSAESPTITAMATATGVIIGTAAYMAPEQAKGRVVDKRADIWAFGAVVYEMLTGKRAFAGEDVSDTLAAVIRAEVKFDALPKEVPAPVRHVLTACLQRDPKQRVHDIADVRLALAGSFDVGGDHSAEIDAALPAAWPRAAWASLATLLVGGLVGWSLGPAEPPPQSSSQFIISAPPSPTPLLLSSETGLAISPDGDVVAYRAVAGGETGLYLRHVDRLDGELLWSGDASSVFFSPDGDWVGFAAVADNTFKKVPITGGPAITLCPTGGAPRGASWGSDDTIIFAAEGSERGLFRVSAAGGTPERLTEPEGERPHFWPEMLPGNRAVLFTSGPPGPSELKLIEALDLVSGERHVLIRGGSHPRYVSSGHLVYSFNNTLRAVRFDLNRLEVFGEPIPLLDQVSMLVAGGANVDVSGTDTLVYQRDTGRLATDRTLVWVSRSGEEDPLPFRTRGYGSLQLSPDGRRLVVTAGRVPDFDLFVFDLDRGVEERFTVADEADAYPVWSPDGSEVVFSSARHGDGPLNLYLAPADGSGTPRRLTTASFIQAASDWVGDTVVFGGNDIMTLQLGADAESETLWETDANENLPAVSPNGRWVAYRSDVTGTQQIYVRPFPDISSGAERLISDGPGTDPIWGPDGTELFYLTPEAAMVVPVDTGERLRRGSPQRLFSMEPYYEFVGQSWDISPDGQRFLMVKRGEESDTHADVIVVEHLTQRLQRLFGE